MSDDAMSFLLLYIEFTWWLIAFTRAWEATAGELISAASILAFDLLV